MTPQRLQRRRTKGWRLPPTGRCVTRPGPFGNPFRLGDDCPTCGPPIKLDTPELVVHAFREYAEARLVVEPGWLDPLRGKDLYCFCAAGAACHADVLIELANRPVNPFPNPR